MFVKSGNTRGRKNLKDWLTIIAMANMTETEKIRLWLLDSKNLLPFRLSFRVRTFPSTLKND
jgi:hypothetical protein